MSNQRWRVPVDGAAIARERERLAQRRHLMDMWTKVLGRSNEPLEEVRLEIGSHQQVIIEKMFGPLIMADLRITPNTTTCEWVIERAHLTTGEWTEVARFEAQPAGELTDDDE